MSFPGVASIETPRLFLAPVAHEHLADLLEVNGDEAVTRFVPYATWSSHADGQGWLGRMQALAATGTAQQLVVGRRDDRKVIGTVLLFKYEAPSRRLELGYVLGRAHWGRGYMREALAAVRDHAFGPMGLRRLEAEVNPANEASCRLLERLGFRLEGTLRQRWTGKGVTYDTRLYGLLAEDPRP